MTGWAEKYRPKTLDEIVGNPTAVAELRKWAAAWDKGRPDKRAVILQGDPGIGKTSAALALANDYYALPRRSSSLKRLCKTIKFQGVHEDAMKNILRTIASKEGVDVADDVLEVIVERAAGDLRSAINDLESLAVGRRTIVAEATRALGYRDRARTIFPVLEEILRSGDARRARDAVRELDESPEDLILWVDQNLAHEYARPDDLVRGYEALSRADIYLGRTRRRQRYGLWSYASEMMSSGVA